VTVAERVLVVVTADGSEEGVLAPEHGRGVHLEEMGELSKAGRSRNGHRVAVWRGGSGDEDELNENYGRKIKRKENADATQ